MRAEQEAPQKRITSRIPSFDSKKRKGAAPSGEFNFVLTGVGGQGLVFLSEVIARAAIIQGVDAKSFGSYGMAQRGGGVAMHVRLGSVYSPKIPDGRGDILLGLEVMEALRSSPIMKRTGTFILNDYLRRPPGFSKTDLKKDDMIGVLRTRFENVFVLDIAKRIAPKTANMALLGAGYATGKIPLEMDVIKEVVSSPATKLGHVNLESFETGYNAMKGLRAK